jgi:hypothetical protein
MTISLSPPGGERAGVRGATFRKRAPLIRRSRATFSPTSGEKDLPLPSPLSPLGGERAGVRGATFRKRAPLIRRSRATFSPTSGEKGHPAMSYTSSPIP